MDDKWSSEKARKKYMDDLTSNLTRHMLTKHKQNKQTLQTNALSLFLHQAKEPEPTLIYTCPSKKKKKDAIGGRQL